MPHLSDARLMVAHGLRIKGFAAAPVVAELCGMAEREVIAELDALRADGHAVLREGRLSGWALTPDGRACHAERLAADLGSSGSADVVSRCYRQFAELNEPFLRLCTEWQVKGGAAAGAQALNSHDDAAYDQAVIGRLVALDRRVQPIAADLASVLARFERYGPRLVTARERVESGATEWFTGAMIESYHTVWFELHEDLLATLGIERSMEKV